MEIPRKRCPKCTSIFEGEEVKNLYSCDQCGNGYLVAMSPRIPSDEQRPEHRLPRSGAPGNIIHTRDGY